MNRVKDQRVCRKGGGFYFGSVRGEEEIHLYINLPSVCPY